MGNKRSIAADKSGAAKQVSTHSKGAKRFSDLVE